MKKLKIRDNAIFTLDINKLWSQVTFSDIIRELKLEAVFSTILGIISGMDRNSLTSTSMKDHKAWYKEKHNDSKWERYLVSSIVRLCYYSTTVHKTCWCKMNLLFVEIICFWKMFGFFYSADKKIIPTFVRLKKPTKRSVKKTFTRIYRISEINPGNWLIELSWGMWFASCCLIQQNVLHMLRLFIPKSLLKRE